MPGSYRLSAMAAQRARRKRAESGSNGLRPAEVENRLDPMERAAETFDPAQVRPEQIARTGGAAE
jgi:hypothetical protein